MTTGDQNSLVQPLDIESFGLPASAVQLTGGEADWPTWTVQLPGPDVTGTVHVVLIGQNRARVTSDPEGVRHAGRGWTLDLRVERSETSGQWFDPGMCSLDPAIASGANGPVDEMAAQAIRGAALDAVTAGWTEEKGHQAGQIYATHALDAATERWDYAMYLLEEAHEGRVGAAQELAEHYRALHPGT